MDLCIYASFISADAKVDVASTLFLMYFNFVFCYLFFLYLIFILKISKTLKAVKII